jgi:hypothetical protein
MRRSYVNLKRPCVLLSPSICSPPFMDLMIDGVQLFDGIMIALFIKDGV